MLQYIQDFDERTPNRAYCNTDINPTCAIDGATSAATGHVKWMDVIYPYVKSEQLFNCPSDDFRSHSRYRYINGSNYGSYALNGLWGGNQACGPTSSSPLRCNNPSNKSLALIIKPSETIWAVDGGGGPIDSALNDTAGDTRGYRLYSFGADMLFDPGPPAVFSNDNEGVGFYERHLETGNILFMDGHVKAMKATTIAAMNPGSRQRRLFSIEDD